MVGLALPQEAPAPNFGVDLYPMPPSIASITFDAQGDFRAEEEARCALDAVGFSLGHMQGKAPRGLLFGYYDIQKWRNLNREHRRGLHGVLTGDMRFGPVRALLFGNAPDQAIAAFATIVGRRQQ